MHWKALRLLTSLKDHAMLLQCQNARPLLFSPQGSCWNSRFEFGRSILQTNTNYTNLELMLPLLASKRIECIVIIQSYYWFREWFGALLTAKATRIVLSEIALTTKLAVLRVRHWIPHQNPKRIMMHRSAADSGIEEARSRLANSNATLSAFFYWV